MIGSIPDPILEQMLQNRSTIVEELHESRSSQLRLGSRRSWHSREHDFALSAIKLTEPLLNEIQRIESTKWFRLRVQLLNAVRKIKSVVRPSEPVATVHTANPKAKVIDDYNAWKRAFYHGSVFEEKILLEKIRNFRTSPKLIVLVWPEGLTTEQLEGLAVALSNQTEKSFEVVFVGSKIPRLDLGPIATRQIPAEQWETFIDGSLADFWILFGPGFTPDRFCVANLRYALEENPGAKMLFGDEELVLKGGPAVPQFKMGWNRLHSLATNCIGNAIILASNQLVRVTPRATIWQIALEASLELQDDEIVHIPVILGAEDGTSHAVATLPSGELLEKGFSQIGLHVSETKWMESRYLTRFVSGEVPHVTILIPTRDQCGLLQRCIDSLLETTDYASFDIIVMDNDSVEDETLDYLRVLDQQAKISVLPCPGDFNYSRLNNAGVSAAIGSIVVLLNNDTEIRERNWLERLVSYAVLPRVAAVGPRLSYPDQTIQFGGFIVGLGSEGFGHHGFVGVAQDRSDYGDHAFSDRWVSSLTGACLAIRKSVYVELGGLDEEDFPVTYNDVDLCLKAIHRGYKNVYAGSVNLVHHEARSRGKDLEGARKDRALGEAARMVSRWGEDYCDPYYNANLSLVGEPYQLAWPPRRPVLSQKR